MNKVVLMGRLCKDPEIRYTQTNNTMVANFNLAVNRRFAKRGEEKQADFINIIAWSKTAEFCSKYFKKGQQVGIIGRIETGKYEDKDGKTVFTTDVIAEEVYFADTRKEYDNVFGNASTSNPFAEQSQSEFTAVTDDDLLF